MKVQIPLLGLVIMMVIPTILLGINITDYTLTETDYQSADINSSFSFVSNTQKSAYGGKGNANYYIRHSSLPLIWRFDFSSIFEIYKGENENDSLLTNYNLRFGANADKYIKNSKFFGYGSFDLGYNKDFSKEKADKPLEKIGVGGGYGRFYDATALARAMQYIYEMKKYGIINSDISDKAYLELAKIIDKKREYETKYGTIEYLKYWFEDIEKVLASENVLKDNRLTPYAVIKMFNALYRRLEIRQHGWRIFSGIRYYPSNYDDTDNDLFYDMNFEFALPYKYLFQLTEKLKYSTILTDKPTHRIKNKFALNFRLTDKIDWENSTTTTITIPSDKDKKNTISNSFTSTFYYYIVNTVSANISLRLSKIYDGIDNNGNDDLQSNIKFGIQYSFR